MLEILITFVLATTKAAPIVDDPMAYRCVVRHSETKVCVLWYDPETQRYFDKDGIQQPAPW
jgi:hypothetical protein